MRVLWIDPGESVGWATATLGQVAAPESPWHIGDIEWGIEKLKPFALRLLERAGDYDVIGFERYIIHGGRDLAAHLGTDVPTLQLVGMIRLAAWRAQQQRSDGSPQILWQDPSAKNKGKGAARHLFPVEIQQVIADALTGPHDEGHHGDALLHLAAWYYDLTRKDTA